MVARSLGWRQFLSELFNSDTPIEDRRVGAMSLDELDGLRFDLGCASPTPNDQPNTKNVA
jgi:hypothetical protein